MVDKMIEISGKVDKSNNYNGFRSNISFFIQGKNFFRLDIVFFYSLATEGIDKIMENEKRY